MPDGSDNLVLEHLRAIRAGLDALTSKVERMDERLSHVEIQIGHIGASEGQATIVLGQVNLRLLQLEQQGRAMGERLAAIERRLPNGKDAG